LTDQTPQPSVEEASEPVVQQQVTPEMAAASADPLPPEEYLLDGVPDEVLRIELDKFAGPFEVLLYLIRAQEIDIFDIPIVKVTEQYLRFLDLLREENLDVAGEFLVMAATLIQIKSKMLLPVEIDEDEEEEIEEEDPRLDLVEKLLEYRKFRDLSDALGERLDEVADWFSRRVKPKVEAVEDEDEVLDVSLYDLIKAVRSVLRFVTGAAVHEVQLEGSSVDDKIAYIEERLEANGSITWVDLYNACNTRMEVVCCLLAILELCRMHRIRAHQHHSFADIRIFAKTPDEEIEPGVVEV
jgi:segregation and condensation protein A